MNAEATADNLGPLLEGWANVEGVRFVSRSHGQYTTATVSRDCLLDLMRAVQAAERERCAVLCERIASVCAESAFGARKAAGVAAAESCARLIRSGR